MTEEITPTEAKALLFEYMTAPYPNGDGAQMAFDSEFDELLRIAYPLDDEDD